MYTHDSIEKQRMEVQEALDRAKAPAERNRLGQFATPSALAMALLQFAKTLLPPREPVRFLDPAFGTGAFYSALLRCFPSEQVAAAVGYEIDPDYGGRARDLWAHTGLRLYLEDFTRATPPVNDRDRASLVVCNPPYVRHHHIGTETKDRLRLATVGASAAGLSGLAGLHCHFMLLSHAWMARDGLAVWLVPSEFMDVNYGRPLKEYLLNRVTLLRVHRFSPAEVQFDDATVSSAVVCFRNAPPARDHVVEFTYGGTLAEPERVERAPRSEVDPHAKWAALGRESMTRGERVVRVSDLFVVKRGIATGANGFFIVTEEQADALHLPSRFLRPILPSPRFLRADAVEADEHGMPVTGQLAGQRLLLVDCRLPEERVREAYPSLWRYLETGIAQGISSRYLCRSRSPWYAQESREVAPILCTYMGRQVGDRGAFRFILNRSQAIAANVYLMLYPKPALARVLDEDPELLTGVWQALREIPWEALRDVGRVYGGGLHKLEPKELSDAPAEEVLATLPHLARPRHDQLVLLA